MRASAGRVPCTRPCRPFLEEVSRACLLLAGQVCSCATVCGGGGGGLLLLLSKGADDAPLPGTPPHGCLCKGPCIARTCGCRHLWSRGLRAGNAAVQPAYRLVLRYAPYCSVL